MQMLSNVFIKHVIYVKQVWNVSIHLRKAGMLNVLQMQELSLQWVFH